MEEIACSSFWLLYLSVFSVIILQLSVGQEHLWDSAELGTGVDKHLVGKILFRYFVGAMGEEFSSLSMRGLTEESGAGPHFTLTPCLLPDKISALFSLSL